MLRRFAFIALMVACGDDATDRTEDASSADARVLDAQSDAEAGLDGDVDATADTARADARIDPPGCFTNATDGYAVLHSTAGGCSWVPTPDNTEATCSASVGIVCAATERRWTLDTNTCAARALCTSVGAVYAANGCASGSESRPVSATGVTLQCCFPLDAGT